MAERCKDLDPDAHVFAKTGSLGGVKTLSGYGVTAKGEPLVFSILTNNFSLPAKRVDDAIDDVIEAAVNDSRK
jgi:D-alanyl-D-alanine carboxypeptidase/D-alanyl-D-alanine-endopeptidase (penicillin-binding protein 4)